MANWPVTVKCNTLHLDPKEVNPKPGDTVTFTRPEACTEKWKLCVTPPIVFGGVVFLSDDDGDLTITVASDTEGVAFTWAAVRENAACPVLSSCNHSKNLTLAKGNEGGGTVGGDP